MEEYLESGQNFIFGALWAYGLDMGVQRRFNYRGSLEVARFHIFVLEDVVVRLFLKAGY